MPIVNGIYDREHGHAHGDGQPPPFPTSGAPLTHRATTVLIALTDYTAGHGFHAGAEVFTASGHVALHHHVPFAACSWRLKRPP